MQAACEFLSPGLCMTGLSEIQETRTTILLRCEELQSHLDVTKERLSRAANQLEELTKILLSQKSSSRDVIGRPWLRELAVGQLVDDVVEAERKLLEVRALAADLGISLPA